MKIVDIVIVIILLLGAFRGFQKGLLLELVGLIAFVVGILGALRLMPLGADILERMFDVNNRLLPFVSFVVVFVIIVLLINLLGIILKKTIDMTILGSFDDLAGSLAGMIKWALAISFLIWLLGYFNFRLGEEYTEGSVIYPFIASLAPWVIESLGVILPFVKEFINPADQEAVPPSRHV